METTKKITIDNAEHYKWGKGCDGWHLVKTEGLSVIREKMPPGTSEQSHLHKKAQQLFYILSGEAVFDIGGEQIHVQANESLHVPPNIIHRIYNNGKDDLHFIVISEPRSLGDRIDSPLSPEGGT
ncbi:MAG: cupin domain-containing protein [Ferruginibacter sp.]